MIRLNKYIAECGFSSRRRADELIAQGKVRVNGKTVTELGSQINEDNDTVMVDGTKLSFERKVYVMFHKPKGCVCTVSDDKGRKTIMDYVNIPGKRVYPIGRLDFDTEGLLLMTNDGDLAYKLMHPSQDIPKTYVVKVEGEVAESDLATLRNGIVLDGIKTHRSKIKLLSKEEGNISRFEVTIFEGRNRQVRRMFESIGKNVIFLRRTQVGSLKLGAGLARGAWRYLTDEEIDELKKF